MTLMNAAKFNKVLGIGTEEATHVFSELFLRTKVVMIIKRRRSWTLQTQKPYINSKN